MQALTDFIEEAPSEPFFSVLWTNQSHYPYFLDTQEARFAVQDRDQNRYLNTVRAADRGLGKLFERLEARGLLDSTLVVVLGDHGEAFGRHGDRGHGGAVYEANIKIPLVFINRKLFRGQTLDTVGGIADIAPTVSEIIGVPRGENWQGRSFADPTRARRTYFFTPWGDLTFGMRDGDMKYIFNATYNKFQVFDVRRDPLESKDLSALHAAELPGVKARLAAWVQFQDRFIRSHVVPPVRTSEANE